MRTIRQALTVRPWPMLGLGRDPDADGDHGASDGGSDTGGSDTRGNESKSNRDRGTEDRMRDIASGREAKERAEARERRDRNDGVSEAPNAPQTFDRAAAVAERAFTQAVAVGEITSALQVAEEEVAGSVKPSRLYQNINMILSPFTAPVHVATAGPFAPATIRGQAAAASYLDSLRTQKKIEAAAREYLGLDDAPRGSSTPESGSREARAERGTSMQSRTAGDRSDNGRESVTYRQTERGTLAPAKVQTSSGGGRVQQSWNVSSGYSTPGAGAASVTPESDSTFNPWPWIGLGLLLL